MIREIYLLTVLLLSPAGEVQSVDTQLFDYPSQCQQAAQVVLQQARKAGADKSVSATCTPI